ncbi:hypothetical protein M271_22455 [Streptomyces rapamycinicus NRRL 5491]|nr:hypothetical protein M271_22455 [Streptomyces rapamycinicus NRRL 5491]
MPGHGEVDGCQVEGMAKVRSPRAEVASGSQSPRVSATRSVSRASIIALVWLGTTTAIRRRSPRSASALSMGPRRLPCREIPMWSAAA